MCYFFKYSDTAALTKCNNEGRNKFFKYNTTQNDRGTLYLLFIYKSKQKKLYTKTV